MAEPIGPRQRRAVPLRLKPLLTAAGVAMFAALAAGDVAASRADAASPEVDKAKSTSVTDSTANADAATAPNDIATLRAMFEQQQRQIEAQQRQIEYLQHALTEVREAQAKAPLAQSDVQLPVAYRTPQSSAAATGSRPAAIPSAGHEEPTGAITVAEAAPEGGREKVGERPPEEKKAPPELPAIADLGGVLTPKGVLSLEPSVTASHSSTARFLFRGVEILPSFLIGVIEVNEANRDFVSPSLTARYGITNSLEGSVSVPYVYRSDHIKQSGASLGATTDERDVHGSGIGDVEVGLQYQINKGKAHWPIMVANVRAKIPTGDGPFDVPRDTKGIETKLPTGSGFYGVQPSVTFIKAMDPLVFYGNASYLVNLSRNINQTIPVTGASGTSAAFIGKVDPGDALGVSFGGALAITENVSVSLGYDHYYVFGTKQQTSSFDASGVPGAVVSSKSRAAQVGTLNFGVNFRSDKGHSFSLTLGAGLTDDAPDVSLTLRRPLSWEIGP